MTTPITNGFLITLFVLASGYIIYTTKIVQLIWRNFSGYTLYFFTIAAGLVLLYVCYLSLYILEGFGLLPLDLDPEQAPLIIFPFALIIWVITTIFFYIYDKYDPEWKYRLNLSILSHKGLDQFVYEKIQHNKTIMVTLENNKVYIGWPLAAPNNEDNQWLRLVPEWSGYRDENSNVHIDTDYTKGYDPRPSEGDYMLISVDNVVTVQPFDIEVFLKFNPTV